MPDPFIQPGQEAPAAEAPTQGAPFVASVAGNRQDDIRRQEAIDPTESEDVTDEEQAQYDDFVSRAIAMIADNRKPEGGGKSPTEAVLNVMNDSTFSVPQALAAGTVSTIKILYAAAKQAGTEYSPDVMFHGADEVIAGLYLLGSAAGIFPGAPSHDWASQDASAPDLATPAADPAAQAAPVADPAAPVPAQGDPAMAAAPVPADGAPVDPAAAQGDSAALPSEGDFTDEEYALLGEAKIMAVEAWGKYLLDSGQITEKEQAEAQQFWQSQIAKEVETGQVDDSVFDNVDVDALRQQMMAGKQGV